LSFQKVAAALCLRLCILRREPEMALKASEVCFKIALNKPFDAARRLWAAAEGAIILSGRTRSMIWERLLSRRASFLGLDDQETDLASRLDVLQSRIMRNELVEPSSLPLLDPVILQTQQLDLFDEIRVPANYTDFASGLSEEGRKRLARMDRW
jgi:hypothetical protein